MFHWFLRCLALLTLVLLVACGGGGAGVSDPGDGGGGGGGGGGGDDGGGGGGDGGGPTPAPTALFMSTPTEEDHFRDVLTPDRILLATGLPGSAETHLGFASLPTEGGTTYTGYMNFAAYNANVYGQTTLDISFGSMSISGTANGFMGTTENENLVQTMTNYAGEIAITNGSIATNGSGSAGVTLFFSGSLDSGLNEFDISGKLAGYMYDLEDGKLHAQTGAGSGGNISILVDGSPFPFGSATIWASAPPTTP